MNIQLVFMPCLLTMCREIKTKDNNSSTDKLQTIRRKLEVVSKEKNLESLNDVFNSAFLVSTNHMLLLFASRKEDSSTLAYDHPLVTKMVNN